MRITTVTMRTADFSGLDLGTRTFDVRNPQASLGGSRALRFRQSDPQSAAKSRRERENYRADESARISRAAGCLSDHQHWYPDTDPRDAEGRGRGPGTWVALGRSRMPGNQSGNRPVLAAQPASGRADRPAAAPDAPPGASGG